MEKAIAAKRKAFKVWKTGLCIKVIVAKMSGKNMTEGQITSLN